AVNRLRVFMLDRPFHRSIHLMPLSQKPAPPHCQRFSSPLVCKRDERSQGALSSAGRYRIHADCNLATNAGSHMPAEQLNVENTAAPCFIKGAVIATDNGDISIENLQLDDLVKAKDNRLRSIRWMNSQGPDPGELMWPPNSRAIRIARAATRCQ
ncbi:Hint domain-containing protein, partial [Paracoccus pantotrophus]|uniref:Hint domain-containing protein n=1 Tax=Paracoccus pantotrophus TaxID=82367 RepID=UPI001C4318DA